MDQLVKASLDILLVEDNQDDIRFTKMAFEINKIPNRLRIVKSGEEALDYIFHRGDYEDSTRYPAPGLLILDLDVPHINGVDVLRIIKKEQQYRTIPIIMLTTSARDTDALQCYKHSANSYIVKPPDFQTFTEIIGQLAHYWLGLNELPDAFRRTTDPGGR